MAILDDEALVYHAQPRPGKVEVTATKACSTQKDLTLAYSPGVAAPVRKIAENPDDVFTYTAKGNLVAVISNGTAVLGLGNVGAAASKPVMEGKGVLFKRFADIDVFDLELNTFDVDEFVNAVKLLEPTFGGINLEDIKAPECFEIESRLKEAMGIPVFHDDQHGTAIIAGAGLMSACEVTGKSIENIKLVINGAGASALACARFFLSMGLRRENLLMVDSKGVLYEGRQEGLNQYKEEFLADTPKRTLAQAMDGADVFVGLSVAGAVTAEMVASMAENPVVFALANPDPEITYEEAKASRTDVIVATGRSDYPNQINNVLGFPFIFRGALDVRAKQINEQMKLAAAKALHELAKEPMVDAVLQAYNLAEGLEYGREYLIPKPFDPRVALWVAPAVAQAAMESGAASQTVNLDEYKARLRGKFGI